MTEKLWKQCRILSHVIVAICLFLAFASSAHADCSILFVCSEKQATINGKTFGIVCGKQTKRDIEGTIGHTIRASGPWRRGLVAPGTPMITTNPQLCYDCFIHVSDLSFSNGCLGTTRAAFKVLQGCGGSAFKIK